MSGFPRSGSTLIQSILNQNSDIYASSNSNIVPIAAIVESSILMSESYNANPRPRALKKTVAGIIENFYSDREEKFIIDKSRLSTIPEHFRCIQRNFDYSPKIIIPVRNITDVLASFIKLIRNSPKDKKNFIDIDIEKLNDINLYLSADDTRVDYLMKPKGLIDNQLYGIAFMLQKEFRKYAHFVEYDDLMNNPSAEIEKIYKFLDIPLFEHNFNNIKNVTPEKDEVYGLQAMHYVRKNISKSTTDAQNILSEYAYNKYKNLEFWRAQLNP